MDWKSLKGFIFDLDGTLYSQKKMRAIMLSHLVFYYGCRPHRIRELYALYCFRKMREKSEYKFARFEDLYNAIEKKAYLPTKKIEESIRNWLFQVPLLVINACAYKSVITFANQQFDEGKKIFIYSDYPAEDKLDAIGMKHDVVFAFGEDGIDEQKPSLRIMETILSKSGLKPNQLLYIGDRDDKDRVSADLVHIQYCDIRIFKKLVCGNTSGTYKRSLFPAGESSLTDLKEPK